MGRGSNPAKGKGRPAVPRKSLASEDARIRDLEKRLADALKRQAEAKEQQAATSEILRLVAESPADLPAVLDGILGAATTIWTRERADGRPAATRPASPSS